MTKGSTASLKDTGFLNQRRAATRWPLRNHSLFGRLRARKPSAGALSRPAQEEAGAEFQADKTRGGTEQPQGRARLPRDCAV